MCFWLELTGVLWVVMTTTLLRAALFRVLFTLNQNSIVSPLILGTEVGQTRRILGLLLCGIASLH